MTPHELRATRELLELTPEQLASDLDLTPEIIHAWEQGTARPSKYHVRLLEWYRATRERRLLMDAHGLRECVAAADLLERLMKAPGNGSAQQAALDAHLAACPMCIATADFAKTLPPLPDYPADFSSRAFVAISDRIDRFPPWARPAAWGALLVGGLASLRALAMLFFGQFRWEVLLLAAFGFLAGAYLGAVGGLVYFFVRPRTRHLHRLGDYLTGIACAGGYFLAFLVPAALAGEEFARDPVGWLAASILSVILGLMIGHFMFRSS